MTIRPILFSGPMVRALLEGRKTQTRRVIKPQPGPNTAGASVLSTSSEGQTDQWTWLSGDITDIDGFEFEEEFKTGYAPGDLLWVRESFSYDRLDVDRDAALSAWYWADGNPENGDWSRPKPSIHMPRLYSRLTLDVKDVRVQRLRDINGYDAYWEGCNDGGGHRAGHPSYTIREFQELWDSINGKRAGSSWNDNPWIVAVAFDVIAQNIDDYLRKEAA